MHTLAFVFIAAACSVWSAGAQGPPPPRGLGRSLAETQKRVTLEAYKGWDRYDTNLQGHIAQVYATLKGTR